jgi:hypothetical protein
MWWWTAALASPHVTHSGRLIDPTGEPLDTTASVTFELRDPSDVVVYSEAAHRGVRGRLLRGPARHEHADRPGHLRLGPRRRGARRWRRPDAAALVDGARARCRSTALVQVSAAPTTCSSGAAGALRFAGGAMSFCNGTDWIRLAGRKPAPVLVVERQQRRRRRQRQLLVHDDGRALQFSTERAEGTHSMSALVYGNAGTGTPDWAIETATGRQPVVAPPGLRRLGVLLGLPAHRGHRLRAHAVRQHHRVRGQQEHLLQQQTARAVPSCRAAWMICVFWGASQIYFKGPGATAFWSYPGYHTDWKSLRMEKRGTQLEFFINGVSQGVRTMPTISVDEPRKLYINGRRTETSRAIRQPRATARRPDGPDRVLPTVGRRSEAAAGGRPPAGGVRAGGRTPLTSRRTRARCRLRGASR